MHSLLGEYHVPHMATNAVYIDIDGFTIAPQTLLPYGHLYNASLAGNQLNSAHGFAGPILAAPHLFNKQT